MKQPERNQSKGAHREFRHAEDDNSVFREPVGEPSSNQAANSESQHEGAHDPCDRLHVHAINGEQGALPHDLVNQRGKSGTKEQSRNQSGLGAVFVRAAAEQDRPEQKNIDAQHGGDGKAFHGAPKSRIKWFERWGIYTLEGLVPKSNQGYAIQGARGGPFRPPGRDARRTATYPWQPEWLRRKSRPSFRRRSGHPR